jgi:hypothetical protein
VGCRWRVGIEISHRKSNNILPLKSQNFDATTWNANRHRIEQGEILLFAIHLKKCVNDRNSLRPNGNEAKKYLLHRMKG